MALNSLFCADVPLSNYSHSLSSRVRARIRIRFSVWLVSGYANVFIPFSVVIIPYPYFWPSSRVRWDFRHNKALCESPFNCASEILLLTYRVAQKVSHYQMIKKSY